jgi:hypothetical protein
LDPNTNSDQEQQKWLIKVGIFVEKLVVFLEEYRLLLELGRPFWGLGINV